jgi:amiloride-sensitive sodium channel
MGNSLLKSITQESSIHGLRHTTDERRNKFSQFIWFCFLCASISLLFFSGYNVYLKWNVEPETGLRVNYKTMTVLPFPAVTICSPVYARNYLTNYTRLTDPDPASQRRGYTPVEQNYLAANIHRCQPSNTYNILKHCTNRTRFDTVNLMRDSSINTRDFLRSCSLRGRPTNCSVIVNRVLTDYGFCYNFNMLDYEHIFNEGLSVDFASYHKKVANHTSQWSLEEGYQSDDDRDVFPIRLSKLNTLSLYFYLNDNDTMNNCMSVGRVFTIMLHQPNEIPTIFHEEMYIPYGNRKTIILMARIYKTAESLRKYAPGKRGCYFDGERQLKFFKSYTKSHCDFECMTNFTLAECGCVKFSMPRSGETPICDIDRVACYTEAMQNWPRNAKSETPCSCYPTCNYIKYSVHFQKDAPMGEFMANSVAGESRT